MKSVWTANNHDISIQYTRIHLLCCCCIPTWRRSPLKKSPSLTYFCATCHVHVCIRNLCNRFGSMFSHCSWISVVINYTCSVDAVSSYLSSLHTLEPNIQVHQLCTKKNITPTWADLAEKPKCMCRGMITSSLPSLVNIYQSVLYERLCFPIHIHE